MEDTRLSKTVHEARITGIKVDPIAHGQKKSQNGG